MKKIFFITMLFSFLSAQKLSAVASSVRITEQAYVLAEENYTLAHKEWSVPDSLFLLSLHNSAGETAPEEMLNAESLTPEEIRWLEVRYLEQGLRGFPFMRIIFTPEMKDRLEFLAYWLKENPGAKLELTGYTCNLGKKKQNKEVAMIRVQTVKEYLLMRGIEDSRIVLFSKGCANPLLPNDCDENRFMNRRVEFKIVE